MDAHTLVNLFHILLVVPFFLYVGTQRIDIPEIIFPVLLGLGVIVTLYHGYKAAMRYAAGSSMIWVNLIHALYLGPLLMYIGYKKQETPRYAFEVLLLFAFAAGGYHLYEMAAYTVFKQKSAN